jgi:hypothetical protein
VDQITIALNRARYLLAKVGRAVERVLNRLHREIRVSTIYDLEDKVILFLKHNTTKSRI